MLSLFLPSKFLRLPTSLVLAGSSGAPECASRYVSATIAGVLSSKGL